MSDVIDMAQDFDALNLAQGLAAQKIKAAHTVSPKPCGQCLNADCEAPFENPQKLFCDPLCERQYSRRIH